MKKKIAVLLVTILSVTLLGGCGTEDEAVLFPGEGIFAINTETSKEPAQQDGELQQAESSETPEAEDAVQPSEPEEQLVEEVVPARDKYAFENVAYMLIYNPNTYNGVGTLSTGSIKDQIIENREKVTADIEAPAALLKESYWNRNRSLILAGIQYNPQTEEIPVYAKGDKKEFFYGDPAYGSRDKGEFTCIYAGTYCNIWDLDKSMPEKNARARGAYFDKTIYPKLTALYGSPRFAENESKVNILVYPMEEDCTGFFTWADIYSSAEIDGATAEILRYNTDHAIINLNSLSSKEQQNTALAREFENLITASDTIAAGKLPYAESFLNVVMAVHAVETLEPGNADKAGLGYLYYKGLANTEKLSLYNTELAAENTFNAGAVYLFEKYLEKNAGTEVFAAIHDMQRRSDWDDFDTAATLLQASGDEFISSIAAKYNFDALPAKTFADENDMWLGKVTLDFYLQTVELSQVDPAVYAKNFKLDNKKQTAAKWKDCFRTAMLYAGLAEDDLYYSSMIDIYGGGCILVQLAEGTFTEPEDADDGLVYIGFDENMTPVCTSLAKGGSFLGTEE